MRKSLYPFRFLLITVPGWMNQQRLQLIDYFLEENRVLLTFVRGSFAESQMGAVLVEVADTVGKKSAQVALVGGNCMIEQFTGPVRAPLGRSATDCARTCATIPFPCRGR